MVGFTHPTVQSPIKHSPAQDGALQHRSELAIASWPVAPGGVLMGMREQRPGRVRDMRLICSLQSFCMALVLFGRMLRRVCIYCAPLRRWTVRNECAPYNCGFNETNRTHGAGAAVSFFAPSQHPRQHLIRGPVPIGEGFDVDDHLFAHFHPAFQRR